MKQVARWLYARGMDLLRGTGIGKYRLVRRFNEFVVARLKSSSVVVDGHSMVLDPNDSLRLSVLGVYEPVETALMKKEIKPGDVVLDIGANIGYYTLLAARQVGPTGRVYAFEPEPSNFDLLQKNITLNGYTNVVAVNKAVSDRSGKLTLYLSKENKGDHRAYTSDEDREAIGIECITIDEFLQGSAPRVDFVKMDIQGFECHALRGMRATLARAATLKLTAEFWPYGLSQAGDSGEALIDLLKDAGFTLYDISEAHHGVEPVDMEDILRRYGRHKMDFTNLYCIKA